MKCGEISLNGKSASTFNQQMIKRSLGFLLFFIIGVLVTALTVPTLISPPKKPNSKSVDAPVVPLNEPKVQAVSRNEVPTVAAKLVSITLPSPPAIAIPAAPVIPTQAEQKVVVQTNAPNKLNAKQEQLKRKATKLKPSRLGSSDRPVKKTQSKLLDASSKEVESLGFAMLNDKAKDAPKININMPESAAMRTAVSNNLRACLGVSMGKINSKGRVVAQENSRYPLSAYVRLVQGALTAKEHAIANQWRQLPGSIVRFYPEYLDARLLGGLQSMLNSRLDQAKVQGEYHFERGVLSLNKIQINGQSTANKIIISKQC